MLNTGPVRDDEGSIPPDDTERTWRYELSFLPTVVWHYTGPLSHLRLLSDYLGDAATLTVLPGDAATER